MITLDHLASSGDQLLNHCHSVDGYVSGRGYRDAGVCICDVDPKDYEHEETNNTAY